MRTKPSRGNASKATAKLAGALQAAQAMGTPATPESVAPGPPQAIVGPSPMAGNGATTPMPVAGAADGLGAGTGGLAVHPSLKAAKIGAYEPRHSSKHR
jgi:hypothetical protein